MTNTYETGLHILYTLPSVICRLICFPFEVVFPCTHTLQVYQADLEVAEICLALSF